MTFPANSSAVAIDTAPSSYIVATNLKGRTLVLTRFLVALALVVGDELLADAFDDLLLVGRAREVVLLVARVADVRDRVVALDLEARLFRPADLAALRALALARLDEDELATRERRLLVDRAGVVVFPRKSWSIMAQSLAASILKHYSPSALSRRSTDPLSSRILGP